MFPSEVSGIAFTQDPNDLPASQIIIEASFGLGQAVVSGDVTPDKFVLRRDDLSVARLEIGHKATVVDALGNGSGPTPRPTDRTLDDQQLRRLGQLALRIEQHFGYPADIEWGFADGAFALLQCRPIRGLDVARDVEIGRNQQIEHLRSLSKTQRRVWVLHNLAETLRAPTPLTWSIIRDFMKGDGGFGRLYQTLGYRPSKTVRRDGFLELICGRIYADPQRLATMFFDGMPLCYDLDQLLADKSLLDRAPARFDTNQADGRFLLNLPDNLWAMRRTAALARKRRRTATSSPPNRCCPASSAALPSMPCSACSASSWAPKKAPNSPPPSSWASMPTPPSSRMRSSTTWPRTKPPSISSSIVSAIAPSAKWNSSSPAGAKTPPISSR